MMGRIKKALWLVLAMAFLVEAWLWEQLEPLLTWLGRLALWAKIRRRVEGALSGLPPWAGLLIFAVPFAFVEPLKLVALWLLAQGSFKAGIATFVTAHLFSAGVSVFLFDILRPKLMTIGWFATAFGWLIHAHAWALEQTAPLRQQIRDVMAKLRRFGGRSRVRLMRRIHLLRRMLRRDK